jgi:hypothetical protein
MRWIVLSSLLGALLSGCAATAPTMPREQWAAVVEREYPNVTRTQAFDAAERLLGLADKMDVQFARNEQMFEAFRDWSKYAVLWGSAGSDYWTLAAREHAGGVHLTAEVSRQAQAISASFPAGASPVASTGDMAPASMQGRAIYDLFWARMDYLLGRRADWPTCEDAKARLARGEAFGSIDPLCNGFNIDNEVPTARIIDYPAATQAP